MSLARLASLPDDEFDISERIRAQQAQEQARKELTRRFQALLATPAPSLTLVPKRRPKTMCACGAKKDYRATTCIGCYNAKLAEMATTRRSARYDACRCGKQKRKESAQCKSCYDADRGKAVAIRRAQFLRVREGFPAVVSHVLTRAAQLTFVSFEDLIGSSRTRRRSRARFLVMSALRARGMSMPQIGKHIGNRDSTTVHHGLKQAKAIAAEDPAYAAKLEKLTAIALAYRFGCPASPTGERA